MAWHDPSLPTMYPLQPPLLNRPGMGVRLITYYRKKDGGDTGHLELKKSELPIQCLLLLPCLQEVSCVRGSRPKCFVFLRWCSRPCVCPSPAPQSRPAGVWARCSRWATTTKHPSWVSILQLLLLWFLCGDETPCLGKAGKLAVAVVCWVHA